MRLLLFGLVLSCGGAAAVEVHVEPAMAVETDAASDAPLHRHDAPVLPADAAPEPDAAPEAESGSPEHRCAAFVDRSAAGADRRIFFPGSNGAGAFDPACLRIARGQSVVWVGSFDAHPVEPLDGDPASPIATLAQGAPDMRSATFPSPGVFSFYCTFHPGVMRGAIEVMP